MITIDYITKDLDSKYAISDSAAIKIINDALTVHTFTEVILVTSSKIVVTLLIDAIDTGMIKARFTKLCVNGIIDCARYPANKYSELVRRCIRRYKERN